jgi:carboxy-cis,cis-muconate cyclase
MVHLLIPLPHLASFVDVYSVAKTTLSHRQSISILPADSNASDYRGDTLRFFPPTPNSPSPSHLFATSRGTNTSYKGFLSVFSILSTGLLDTQESKIERWQTPTSGGGANAIELKAKSREDANGGERAAEGGVWIALTDDETGAGGVWILEWDGEDTGGVRIVTEWSGEEDGSKVGASHAIWLD